MKTKRLVIIAVAIIVGVTAALIYGSRKKAIIQGQPITIRYFKPRQPNTLGYLSIGTVFWTTNHTSNTLNVQLVGIEVQTGTNWIIQRCPRQSLEFVSPGNSDFPHWLNPHEASYTAIPLSNQPPGTTWRVRVEVAAKLSGIEESAARVTSYPNLLKMRLCTGNTNIPVNPFSTGMSYFGHPTQVVSEDTSETQ